MPQKPLNPGTVYLVGAGPGDPALLTLRGAQLLRDADVVLYDYLVNPAILGHVRVSAEQICLGRHGHGRILAQDEINATMVDRARVGYSVVRLKGGDPSLFGHVAEEVEALTAAGIPYEIVPGVTAAFAAAACSGIPLTHRDSASAVAFVTGQQRADDPAGLDYAALARFPGTLVFYMGVTTAAEWTAALIAAGKPPDTPVAIVRRASHPDQKVWTCRLDETAANIARHAIRPPVLVIVGDVTAFSPRYDWFAQRPLFGKTIVVTRPEKQAASVADAFATAGACVLVQPVVEIFEVRDTAQLDAMIRRLGEFKWIVFSSVNGVEHFLNHIGRHFDARLLGGVKIAAIGPGTAAALEERYLKADLIPDEYRAESLADELTSHVKGQSVLLVRASRGREVLAERLSAAGARVEQVVAYISNDVAKPKADVAAALAAGEVDWITVSSSSIAQGLVRMFGENLRRAKLASISPITTSVLGELGYSVAAEAEEYTMSGIVKAVLSAS